MLIAGLLCRRDPDNDELRALAIAGQADVIVSGDKDSRSIGRFEGIPIIAPAEALARIARRPKDRSNGRAS